jgi:cytochrome c oxidase cbb3-type subunit 4
VSLTLIQSLWTILVMVAFIGIVIWAWSGKRKQRFEDAANIPFTEDEQPKSDSMSKENSHG